MGFDNLSVKPGELEDKTVEKISVSGNLSGSQSSSIQSDGFVVEIERFSHLLGKDIDDNNPRITLQRNLSRKGSPRICDSIPTAHGREAGMLAISPKAILHGGGTAEMPADQHHHQITITSGGLSNTAAIESKWGAKRFGFRRSATSLTIDPRRILLIFATMSSMGTIVLIYFTLCMSKFNGDDSAPSS